MEPTTAVEALSRLGGIATTGDLLALTTRARLRSALARGEVVRVSRGRLALRLVASSLRSVQLAGGHLSHLSAALHHGWKVREMPEVPQIVMPPGARVPDGTVGFLADVHHRELRAGEKSGWATSPLRTVLDCSADLPLADALSVADSALRSGTLSSTEFRAAAGPRHLQVATYADARAANPFESTLRALCIEVGLEVVPQYEITCGELTFHPDLVNPLLGLVIEADSFTFHGRPTAFERDVVRYNALTAHGWTVLRFTWHQVMHRADYVKATLLQWIAQPQR
ncbi:DUF559 domain-containing protein [Nocardioides sp. AE5]|uniref:DUF559 domain-containing protein n=1 Tax=Nocardioides sp. AE5 TaxID=2962573 RepID=UPI0028829F9C|nr:DUF559 domain-containing protein [Nocardioides sp. AE5]MDT0201900.1 DUF559 domain-containing protein [Nocardioides sp. AE5]